MSTILRDSGALNENSIRTEYNNLLSSVFSEFGENFAAIASPTLSKQETVTFLFKSIQEGTQDRSTIFHFPWRLLLEFIPRLALMFTKVVFASLSYRVKNLPEGAVIFKTWLVPRSLAESTLNDDYFRQLPEDLEAFEKTVVSFTTSNFGLLNQFGKVRKNENQIISYGLLSLFEVVKLFFDYIFNALIQVNKNYFLKGNDVTGYINRSLLLDYLLLRSFEAYSEKYKCKKFIEHKIKAFVYVFENQSLEKACCAILRGHNIRLIGYQSSGFSPIFLNFFPTEDDAQNQPMPDILLTVGDHFRKYLIEYGHYQIPVESFAALRFSYPINEGCYVVNLPNPNILSRILYAFPVHIEQYEKTIIDLIRVFQGSGIEVDLKLHPLYMLNDAKTLPALPENFRVLTKVDMDCLRDDYDCVLFNDNSFGIEALLKGVRSYQYSRDGSFEDDRFMYFNLWQVNFQLEDVYLLKDQIQVGSYNKVFDVQSVSAYINSMYQPYTRESLSRFREILDSCN
jgi:hypothetical protein